MRWGGRGCVRGEIIQDTKTWKNGNTSGKRQRKRGKKRKRNKDSALDSRCHSVSYKFKDSASLTHGKVHIGTFSNQWWWVEREMWGKWCWEEVDSSVRWSWNYYEYATLCNPTPTICVCWVVVISGKITRPIGAEVLVTYQCEFLSDKYHISRSRVDQITTYVVFVVVVVVDARARFGPKQTTRGPRGY